MSDFYAANAAPPVPASPAHELHVNPHLRQGGSEREVACVLLR